MPDLLLGTDHQTWRSFAGERTHALPVAASTLQLDVFTNDVLDTQASFYFFNRTHTLLSVKEKPRMCTSISGLQITTGVLRVCQLSTIIMLMPPEQPYYAPTPPPAPTPSQPQYD